MKDKAARFENFASVASAGLNWVTCAAFVSMAIITTIDVIGSKLFSKPLLISFDVVSFLGLLGVVPAIAWIQMNHGHIEVEILVRYLPKKVQSILSIIINVLGIALFIVMAWQMTDYAMIVQRTHRTASMASIPLYPFAYFSVLCFVMVVVVLVAQVLKLVTEEVDR
jgi:TRAP-type C4-dicarboxylate transport system permease small subunit